MSKFKCVNKVHKTSIPDGFIIEGVEFVNGFKESLISVTKDSEAVEHGRSARFKRGARIPVKGLLWEWIVIE